MSELDPFTPKYRARNIPENFNDVCERIRLSYFRNQGDRQINPPRYGKIYWQMFSALSETELQEGKQHNLGKAIDEITVRFLAFQKTIDKSVPAAPVYQAAHKASRTIAQAIKSLEDEDRDQIVDEITDRQDAPRSGNLQERFDESESLAEKVTVFRDYLQEVESNLKTASDLFDYKQGLVTRGNPSKYAMAYAVLALADLFERENTRKVKAIVNEYADGNREGRLGRNFNSRRYTGHFLDFVQAFYYIVVPEQANFQNNEGFADQVRKIAQRRGRSPDAHKLLDKDVTAAKILEFMERIDAIKRADSA